MCFIEDIKDWLQHVAHLILKKLSLSRHSEIDTAKYLLEAPSHVIKNCKEKI